MKTLNTLKLKIMVRAFKIRIKNGEDFADIAADYPALTTDDLTAIRDAERTLEVEELTPRGVIEAVRNLGSF